MRAIVRALKKKKVTVWMGTASSVKDKLRLADIAIALGGDGTVLRVARLLAPHSIPLLGINSGGLGFLSATEASEFPQHCQNILNGRFEIEERWMISIEVFRKDKRIFGPHIALNDCVIRCGDQARAISLETRSAERFVANYFGDGLIISTPTGSTAYALAASGPIIEPSLEVLLIAPICPHSLTQRPLIVPAAVPFTVKLATRRAHEAPRVLMSLDGQIGCTLRVGDEVLIRRYDKPFKLLLNPNRSYFKILRQKFKWGER